MEVNTINSIEERKDLLGEINDQLLSGCFPADMKMYYWIPYTLSRLPREDLDYIMYDLRAEVTQICFNTVVKLHFPAQPLEEERIHVCFTSDLCKCSKSKIVYIIAHEFAHAFLGHHSMMSFENPHALEIAADEQVIKWGFEKELKKSGISYIYGKPAK